MPTAAPASTSTVAQELVTLCRAGKNLDAIRDKNERWFRENEVHSANAIGPFVGEGQFAVRYDFDVTNRPSGQRMQMSEMALYTVKDGKIVHEHFFYHVPGA
jgi:predicted ester cyclase